MNISIIYLFECSFLICNKKKQKKKLQSIGQVDWVHIRRCLFCSQ